MKIYSAEQRGSGGVGGGHEEIVKMPHVITLIHKSAAVLPTSSPDIQFLRPFSHKAVTFMLS
jgi:hypothetical protein